MNTPLFSSFGKQERGALKLFCFPYAGGSSTIFSKWPRALPDYVDLYALHPPGRGGRMAEQPVRSMDDMVTRILEQIIPMLDKDYVFFGHSLGSRVAFEVAFKLVALGYRAPKLFIASGSPAPSVRREEDPIHDLPEDAFVEKLRELGGTAETVLQNKELMELCSPALRADFEILETYTGISGSLGCKAHVLYGTQDYSMTVDDAKIWDRHFDSEIKVHAISGDHFFVDYNSCRVLSLLNQALQEIAPDHDDGRIAG